MDLTVVGGYIIYAIHHFADLARQILLHSVLGGFGVFKSTSSWQLWLRGVWHDHTVVSIARNLYETVKFYIYVLLLLCRDSSLSPTSAKSILLYQWDRWVKLCNMSTAKQKGELASDCKKHFRVSIMDLGRLVWWKNPRFKALVRLSL